MSGEKHKALRDVRLDGLRVIGLLAIILAHVNPPAWLFQLRNFDVPLMVLVSAISFSISSGIHKPYGSYVLSRVRRLLLPTWIFLTIYFLSIFFIGHPISQNTIISSYALLDGIGYVWIFRVFLLVALVLPILLKLFRNLETTSNFLYMLGIIYVAYESMYRLAVYFHIEKNFLLENILFYLLPYGFVAGLGIVIPKLKRNYVKWLLFGFLIIFLALAALQFHGTVIPTQAFKYPPRLYYLSYALFVGLLLYQVGNMGIFRKVFNTKILLFISSSSLWIYLWQILFLALTTGIENWLVRYIVIVAGAVAVTYIQKYVIANVTRKLGERSAARSLLEDAFLK